MDFFSEFGISFLGGKQGAHGRDNALVKKSTKLPELLRRQPVWPYSIGLNIARDFFREFRHAYIDHESGWIKVAIKELDEEGDLVIEDYDCPDCNSDGGCDHCELDHNTVCNKKHLLDLTNEQIVFKIGKERQPFAIMIENEKIWFWDKSNKKWREVSPGDRVELTF